MKRESITITKGKQGAWRRFLVPTLVLVFSGLIASASADDLSAGFIFDRFKLTLEDGLRFEAAGPFYYSQQADSESLWAIPPFFSDDRDPAVERQEADFLYPVMTRIRYGQERRWQFFELINRTAGENPEGGGARRFTIFPLYFQQRAADTNLNYTAVVPFYGRLKHRLFKDEIYFVMFPFYMETRKRDVVTDNYFFPFVDVRHGDGLKGWQVWPFAAQEHKDITSLTNGFGDVSLIPGHDRSFYMWPFYLSQSNGIGGANPEKFLASIPFFAISRAPLRDSTSVLWPFFTSIDERGRKYHEWEGPWPFVIFAEGEGKHTSRVWPLYSRSHNDLRENNSYAWPLYIHTRIHSDPLDRERTRILFFLYSRLTEKNTETGKERLRTDLWPVFTWHHDLNGNERLQILAPLEPAVPDNPGIERNWSPLWSLWRAEANAKTGARSQSLLWNLYRRETGPAHKSVSVVFGLYQSREDGGTKSRRVFYIPVGHSRP